MTNMKNIFKSKYVLGVFLLLIIGFYSCKNDEHFDFEGNSGIIYLREQIGSAQNPAKGSIINTPRGSFGLVDVKFPVKSTMPANQVVEVTLALNNSLVESYNRQFNTNYSTLDASVLTLDNSKLRIESGMFISKDSINVRISDSKFSELKEGNYLLPIQITSVTGGMAQSVLESNTTVYIVVEVLFDNSNIKPVSDVANEGVIIADRSAWKAEYVGSYNSDAPTSRLFDGDNKSGSDLWGPFSSSAYLIVDLNKEYADITGICLHHVGSQWRYLETNIYSSSDKQNWRLEGTAKDYKAAEENILFFERIKARYIKVQGIRCADFNFVLSEFNIFTKQ